MITYIDVLDAVNRVNGHRRGLIDNNLVKQLTSTLKVYKRRKEFTGTIESALDCLQLSGYEVDHIKLKVQGLKSKLLNF